METIAFVLHYGFRRSEALGLKWSAIDFSNNTLVVKHTITSRKTIMAEDSTKNKNSYQTLPLMFEVKKNLLTLRARQKKYQLLFGQGYTINDHVIKKKNGKLFTSNYISIEFVNILKEKGLPHI